MSIPVILIVSAVEEIPVTFSEYLREAGCHTLTATDEQRGAEYAAELEPTVVVVGKLSQQQDSASLYQSILQKSRATVSPAFVMLPPEEPSVQNTNRMGFAPSDPRMLANAVASLAHWQHSSQTGTQRVSCHGLEIDRVRHRATIDSRELNLTLTEFELIWILASSPGHAHSREDLFKSCRGQHGTGQLRTIDAHIKAIRRKLGHRSCLIETVRGIGYRMRKDEGNSRRWTAAAAGNHAGNW